MPRALAGSEVGFEIPGLGVFYGPNLTPDKATGLGNWTKEQIVTALQTGLAPRRSPTRPDHAVEGVREPHQGRRQRYRRLSPEPPAAGNKVPGPFGPNEKPTSFVMKVVPPPEK